MHSNYFNDELILKKFTSFDGSNISITRQGGHLCSWKSPDGQERIYLSPKAIFNHKKAIRGGIPVVFPQFGNLGKLPSHGFARNCIWSDPDFTTSKDNSTVSMRLTQSDIPEDIQEIFPFSFSLKISFTFSKSSLNTSLEVENCDEKSFEFTTCLHTYLATEIRYSSINGLQNTQYIRNGETEKKNEINSAIKFTGEIDRIYFQVKEEIVMKNNIEKIYFDQYGFSDIVIWNPHTEKCASMDDMPNDGFENFICMESAQIGCPIRLNSKEKWTGKQILYVST